MSRARDAGDLLAPELCECALLRRRGGCLVVDGLLARDVFAALCEEAVASRVNAGRCDWVGAADVDWRGGEPARAFAGTGGGPVQGSIFASPMLAATLSGLCGLRLELAGAGSYSYYDPGDFLALHRDILRCDVTLLTCLHDTGTGTGIVASRRTRSPLRLYPAYALEPLSRIRRDPAPRHVDLFLDPGQTAVLLGGVIPHEVLPMAAGQSRAVSVVCLRADIGSAP